MYSNVLVGIGERDGGRDAIALARTLAPHARRLTLVNVRQRDHPGQRGCAPGDDAAEQNVSLSLLGTLKAELAPDAELDVVIATDVGDAIKTVAQRLETDLIVVGSGHRSRMGRVVSGNDTLSVLHHAPCAVAVAPRGYRDAPRAVRIVGVAYDGSPQSTVALTQARVVAEGLGAELKALDVEQITVYGNGWVAPYVETEAIEIAGGRRRLGDLDGLDLDVVVGQADVELERFSKGVDLVVCGSRELGPIKRVMLGSTSDQLARHGQSALLVVSAGAERPSDPVHPEHLSPTPA